MSEAPRDRKGIRAQLQPIKYGRGTPVISFLFTGEELPPEEKKKKNENKNTNLTKFNQYSFKKFSDKSYAPNMLHVTTCHPFNICN